MYNKAFYILRLIKHMFCNCTYCIYMKIVYYVMFVGNQDICFNYFLTKNKNKCHLNFSALFYSS